MIKNFNTVAFLFVWEELADHFDIRRLDIKAMFGCHAIYLDSKIICILRKRDDPKNIRDNGLWMVLSGDHFDSLKKEFKSLRPIELFQDYTKKGFSTWFNLPEDELDFEESAFEFCNLIKRNDPRLGKLPKSRLSSSAKNSKKKPPLKKTLKKSSKKKSK